MQNFKLFHGLVFSGSFHDGDKKKQECTLENIWPGKILYFDNLFPFFIATDTDTDPDNDTDHSTVA